MYYFWRRKKKINNSFYKKSYSQFPIKNNKINIKIIKKNIKTNNFFLIIDSFKINSLVQKQLLKNNIKWLQFDNFQNNSKIYADIVVNANPLIRKENYYARAYKNKKQLFLTGKNFLILRNEFKKKL